MLFPDWVKKIIIPILGCCKIASEIFFCMAVMKN